MFAEPHRSGDEAGVVAFDSDTTATAGGLRAAIGVCRCGGEAGDVGVAGRTANKSQNEMISSYRS